MTKLQGQPHTQEYLGNKNRTEKVEREARGGAGHTSSSGGMVGEGGTGRHGEVVNILKLKFSKN